MYYNPHVLNQSNFFKVLSPILKNTSGDTPIKEIEEFLYRASCTLVAHKLIYSSERDTVLGISSYINQIKFPENKRISISSDSLTLAYSQIPLSLNSLVCIQNLILPILFKLKKLNGNRPPLSLNDAIKSGITKYGFNPGEETLIKAYWASFGKYLRDVRDIDQHFKILITNTFFEFKSSPGVILVLLPDNPEIKKPKAFTYNKSIDSNELIIENIKALDSLITELLHRVGFTEKSEFTASIGLEHTGDLSKPEERTIGIMLSTTSDTVVDGKRKVELDTVEVMQIIPKDGSGNIAVRKMKTDKELDNFGKA